MDVVEIPRHVVIWDVDGCKRRSGNRRMEKGEFAPNSNYCVTAAHLLGSIRAQARIKAMIGAPTG